MLHSKAIYFITKSNFYGPKLPLSLNFPNFWVTIWGLGAKISAYHINMQGVDRHLICFFVFAGSKKCTRNSTDCLLCLRVLKRIPMMLVERVLCSRVQKYAPAMVLYVVILSVAKDLLSASQKTVSPTSSLRGGLCSTWQPLLRSVSCWAARSISSLVGFEGILRYTQNDSTRYHC